MLIGVPLETAAGETRVAVTPETAKKLVAQGHAVRVQSGAGVAASATAHARPRLSGQWSESPPDMRAPGPYGSTAHSATGSPPPQCSA